jgi:acetoin utilization protein AcuC
MALTCKVAFVYDDAMKEYDFGPSHPLRPIRLRMTYELAKALGLFEKGLQEFSPRLASDAEVGLFHDSTYIELIKKMSKTGQGFLDLGDTPAFKGCYEASCRSVGASLDAADLVMNGKANHGMNISGGLHHAHRDRASGFCIFNDPAVTIAYLREKYDFKRILYLDVDAHHGDGVMYGYYDDASLLDIDFHEDGHYLFPGTGSVSEIGEGAGEGLKVNVPLPPGTTDKPYLSAFHRIVPPLVRNYKPEFILIQSGADAHANDLLAHLWITISTYGEVVETMHQLAHEICEGRLVAFGGGGYQPANVARSWVTISAKLSGAELPAQTPDAWRRSYAAAVSASAPRLMRDQIPEASADIARRIDSIVKELEGRIPGLKGGRD